MREQTEVRNLKEGKYVILDDEPCVIKSITKSKPGKHGAAKARVDAIGIFDGQKRSIVQPVNSKIYVPIVERKSGQVLAISGDTVQLMDMTDYTTLELKIPVEYKDKIEVGKEVTYLTSMGKVKLDIRI
ncbi:MAG: translation initiation factor IF-5A [Methanosarcinales archaeon]